MSASVMALNETKLGFNFPSSEIRFFENYDAHFFCSKGCFPRIFGTSAQETSHVCITAKLSYLSKTNYRFHVTLVSSPS